MLNIEIKRLEQKLRYENPNGFRIDGEDKDVWLETFTKENLIVIITSENPISLQNVKLSIFDGDNLKVIPDNVEVYLAEVGNDAWSQNELLLKDKQGVGTSFIYKVLLADKPVYEQKISYGLYCSCEYLEQ